MNFQVELTSYCDLTCGYCPNKDMQRPRKFMADEVWQAILHLYVVPFRRVNRHCPPTFIGHKDGEPLLNKRLPDRLRDLAAVAPDMSIDVYSHGLLLPKWAERGQDFFEFLETLPNRCRYLMSHHPVNHDYSLNDYGPVATYLYDVLQKRAAGRFGNVEFITVSHKSKWVSDDMQAAWAKLWQGLPITVHCNAALNPWTGRIESEVKFNGCPYGDFGHWFFGATGNVVACCLDLEEEVVLGNVLTHTPAELFTRTEAFYTEQRRRMAAGERPEHEVCADCFGFQRSDLVQLGRGVLA